MDSPQSATELRDYAQHVRELTRGILDTEAVTRLSAYAEELDARADAVEKDQ